MTESTVYIYTRACRAVLSKCEARCESGGARIKSSSSGGSLCITENCKNAEFSRKFQSPSIYDTLNLFIFLIFHFLAFVVRYKNRIPREKVYGEWDWLKIFLFQQIILTLLLFIYYNFIDSGFFFSLYSFFWVPNVLCSVLHSIHKCIGVSINFPRQTSDKFYICFISAEREKLLCEKKFIKKKKMLIYTRKMR